MSKIFSLIIIIGLMCFLVALSGCGESYPQTPGNVKAVMDSYASVKITWDPVSNASGYYVHFIPDLGGIALTGNKSSTKSTLFIHNFLESDTSYSYRVSAYNSSGESPFSNIVSAKTNVARPNTPTGLTASAASESSVLIKWNTVSSASKYFIYRSNSNAGEYEKIGETESNSYENTGLLINTVYYYKVSSFNVSGESILSASVNAKAMALPGIPSGIAAETLSTIIIRISWTAASDAESYIIYRSLSEIGNYIEVGTTTGTAFTNNTGLTFDTPYYYKIAGRNNRGIGELSDSVPIATLPAIELTEGVWAEGNIPVFTNGEQWFKFTATATLQYIHINFSGTLDDLYIQLYDSNMNTVGARTNLFSFSSAIKNIFRTVSTGQVYYIKITPYGSSDKGTYKIAFNNSITAPS